jgi:hypothetical protein
MSSRGKFSGAHIKACGDSLYYKPLVSLEQATQILAAQAQEDGRVFRNGVDLYKHEEVVVPFTGPMSREEVNTMRDLALNYISNLPD